MKKFITLVVFCIACFSTAFSQTNISIGTGSVGNSGTADPSPLQDYWEGSRAQYLFLASELSAAGMGAGNISEIKWEVLALNGAGIAEQLTIKIGSTTVNTLSTAAWDPVNNAITTAPVNYQPVLGINSFTLPAPFLWDGSSNIIVEVCNGDPANGSATTYTNNPTVPWTTGLAFNGSHTYRADDLGNLCGTATTTNSGLQTTRPNIVFSWTPATSCSGKPTAGTATSSTSNVCPNTNFNLSLSGATLASGITYQWQFSTNNTSWTDATGGTNSNFTTSQPVSRFYRAIVRCTASSLSDTSTTVQVTSPALIPASNFTINNGIPTGGSNFQTFADAINYIKCGISGPVVFDVAPGSSYNEQVIIPAIGGVSATNTIVFNGNDAIVNFTSTNTNERAGIKLDGADFITLRNFVITGTGTGTTDFNFGIHLLNGADNNIIKGCTINITAASTSTNYTGIAISGSANSATSTGSNSNYNLIDSNTVTGGYYGVTVNGATGALAKGNIIRRNTFQDWYLYGMYINLTDSTIVEKNTVNRLNRTSGISTFNGIYFTGQTERAQINKNRIHDPFGGSTSSTSAAYGIYFTSADAVAGKENVVSNNLIYNFIGGGIQYGLYNSSSDGARYYHNTVVLDDANYTGTSVTRGFYQITEAARIEVQNNIITISRGGAGAKHVLYFGTNTSNIVSNKNVLFINSSAGTNSVGYYNTSFTTLSNWQSANNNAYDQGSLSVDPLYTNPGGGEYKPSNPQINNLGANVGITTDIVDSVRLVASPDPGAYEFGIGNCTNPPTAGSAVSSVSSACQGDPFTLNLDGNSVGEGQTYQWQVSSNNTTFTNIGSPSTSTAFTTSQTTNTYYRAQVTCGTGTPEFSGSVLVTSPALVSGSFTINNGIPTGGGNFQTFADAVNFMRCGINGPTIFNVAPGGSYTEQVVIPAIKGASATNQIIFNGNNAMINLTSTNTDLRAAIRLDGADHVTITNFNITGTGTGTTDYNFGIQLIGGADSNIIKGNTINLTAASTSTNYAGIVISGTASSATSTGSNSDYNLIDSNTIIGGYYGITVNGASGALAKGNIIRRNTLQDWYFYGMYINLTDSSIIEKNVVNRLNRSVGITTFNGIFLTGQTVSAHVRKNRVHDPFTGLTTSTSAAYGIYFSGADAIAGKENLVSNNLIYNFIGGGTQYGLYNSSSDSVKFYHNTIVLDDAGYTGTSATRGFYQVTQATGIEFKNNVVSIARGGAGAQHNLYFGTTTSTIVSNNNLLYNTATGSTSGIGYYAANFPTLANWQTANTNAYDQQSRSVDPMFLNPGFDYTPTNSLADNFGTPVGITTDIRDSARNTSAPDPGAYEFSTTTQGLNVGAISLVSPLNQGNGCYTANETVTIRIRNASTSTLNFATNPVTVTTQVSGAITQTLSRIINTGTLASDSTLDVTMPTTLNMTAAGVYTFNATATVAGDVNTANDAMLPVNRTRVALTAGTASASPANYCAPSPINPVLTSSGVAGYGSLQWKESAAANGVYTNITGATSISYTVTAPITTTSYYKLFATCGASIDSSAVVTVSYNNPAVSGTTPASRCGTGPVTLSATGSAGSTLNWFTTSTGGLAVGTGNNFTTPSLSANTTYYVAATSGASQSPVGGAGVAWNTVTTTGQFQTTTGAGQLFDVIQPLNIATMDIYPSAAIGTSFNIEVRSGSSTGTIVSTYTGTTTVQNTGTPTVAQTVPVNFNISTPGTYYVGFAGTNPNTWRSQFSTPYPYPVTSPGNLSITGSTLGGLYWYYLYNWVITTGCESARTAVVATVTPSSSPAAGAAGTTECATATIAGTETLISFTDCDPIVSIIPAGASPISGSVNACVTIASTVQSATTGEPYVQRYYNITPANNPSTATARLTLYFLQSEFNAFNAVRGSYPAMPTGPNDSLGKANFRISKFSGTGSTPGNYTGGGTFINPADDSIVWNATDGRWQVTFSVSGFSGFFAHTGNYVLPVTIANFKGAKQNFINKLSWITLSEANNAGFELQRSADGIRYSTISFISSKAVNGSSISELNYLFDDVAPLAGNNYYKLKQMDKDGKSSISPVVLIKSDKVNSISITNIYPNPVKASLNLTIASPSFEQVSLIITDMSGKLIMTHAGKLVTGDNYINIPMGNLSPGTYLIKTICSNGCEGTIQKFVKQ